MLCLNAFAKFSLPPILNFPLDVSELSVEFKSDNATFTAKTQATGVRVLRKKS